MHSVGGKQQGILREIPKQDGDVELRFVLKLERAKLEYADTDLGLRLCEIGVEAVEASVA